MLGLENRLSASSDIKRVVLSGSRVRTKIAGIYVSPSSTGHMRFACVVGKKVDTSSVVRHAVQRKLRAVCREIVTSYSGSYDIVVVALTRQIRFMNIYEVQNEVVSGLAKLGVI